MDLGAVLLALTVSLGIKIPIMFMASRLIMRMGQATRESTSQKPWVLIPRENRPEFNWLFYSLLCFFISEFFCGIETWILMRSDAVMRAIHALSSALGMALFAVGLYILLDKKIIFYGEKKCTMNKICKGCTLLEGKKCQFNSSILLFGVFIFMAVIPPLFVSTEIITADPLKFILPFPLLNGWYQDTLIPFIRHLDPGYKTIGVAFYLPKSTQILENRIFPLIVGAIQLCGISLYMAKDLKLKLRGVKTIIFGAGMLSYTYFEIILNRLLGDLFLGAIGHELGEFIFLLLLAEFLRVTFKIRGPSVEEMPLDRPAHKAKFLA